MKIVKLFVFLLLIVPIISQVERNQTLNAKEIDDLFEISIPVDNQSNNTRKQATKQALIEIMVRISGQSVAASNDILGSYLNKSTAYIQRYLYRETEVTDAAGNQSKQLLLDLFFDELALRNLLRHTGLTRWGSNRPQVLVWVAIGDQNDRFMLGTDNEAILAALTKATAEESAPEPAPPLINLKQTIKEQATKRGLPILLPLMDLEDSIAINVADVWGRFVSPIRQASLRYESDAILAAQIMKTGDSWLARWLLLHNDRTLSWEQESATIESALIAGVDSTTDQLAELYAVFEDSLQRNEILISVSNVQQLEDYAHLMDYLQNLTSIHDVNVDKVSASRLQLRVNLIGKREAMMQAISLNNQLIVESMPLLDSTSQVTQLPALFFRWNSEANLQ